VSGGSVVNLLAVWRAHRLDGIIRECWAAGVVLAGQSAGSVCWHEGGVTDSFGDSLDPITDGLGFLPFSNGVHDDLGEQPRRQRFRDLIAAGELPAGDATEDGVGLHYVGTEFREALGIVAGRNAWYVAPGGAGRDRGPPIPARYWPPRRWGAAGRRSAGKPWSDCDIRAGTWDVRLCPAGGPASIVVTRPGRWSLRTGPGAENGRWSCGRLFTTVRA